MIDKIFELIVQEARSREGDDLTWKIITVVNELSIKIFDLFEEIDEHLYDWLPDDMEELGKTKNLEAERAKMIKLKRGERLS